VPDLRAVNGGLASLGRGRFGRLTSYFTPVTDPFTGYDTLRGPYAAPRLAGKKFKGLNIVPRPTDDGNGPPVSPSVMYEFIYDYLTEGPTGPAWLQWIKPQIDAAKAAGCNCVRFYWDVGTLVGDASHMIPARTINVGLPEETTIAAVTYKGPVSWAQLADGIKNICDYLASQGMYYYPTATECQPVDYVTESGLLDYIDHFIAEIIKYPNVIACDVIMEVDRCTYTQTAANLATVMTRAKAARGRSSLPLTCSISSLFLNNAGWKANLKRVIAAGVDFIDAHIYVRTSWQTLMDYLFENDIGLPVASGESGLTYSGEMFFDPGAVAQEVTHPKSSELRAQHYQDVIAAWGRRFDLQLFTPYGVTDQWPHDTQRWGVFSDAQDGSYNFTTEREEETGPLRTVPTEVGVTSDPWALDLRGPDTAAESLKTFAIGWAQLDISATFSRESHKIKRTHSSAANAGLINEFTPKSLDQTVTVEFNAADATPNAGVINWGVCLRMQDGAANYYLIGLTSSPGTPLTDGLVTIYQMPALSLLGGGYLANPVINLAHVYRLTASAIGAYPTAITVTVDDLTTNTRVGSFSISDNSPALQTKSATSLAGQTGTVYYTSLSVDCNGQRGPTFRARPTLSTPSPTSVDMSWPAATGGVGPYRYVPQYIALDAKQVVATTGDWTTVGDPGGQAGTSVSISGLTPGANYAFRVQVIDDAVNGKTTVSPWALRVPMRFLASTVAADSAGASL
jgi:hypothetical protein